MTKNSRFRSPQSGLLKETHHRNEPPNGILTIFHPAAFLTLFHAILEFHVFDRE